MVRKVTGEFLTIVISFFFFFSMGPHNVKQSIIKYALQKASLADSTIFITCNVLKEDLL